MRILEARLSLGGMNRPGMSEDADAAAQASTDPQTGTHGASGRTASSSGEPGDVAGASVESPGVLRGQSLPSLSQTLSFSR